MIKAPIFRLTCGLLSNWCSFTFDFGIRCNFTTILLFKHYLPTNLVSWIICSYLWGKARVHQINLCEKEELENQNYTNPMRYLLTCCGTYAAEPVLRIFPDISVILNKTYPKIIAIKTENQLNNFKLSKTFKMLCKTAM